MSTAIKSYKDLVVWQKSIILVEEIYKITKSFPQSEQFGLTSQLRRASISIASNIAEGSGRGSRKEYAHFYSIAYGSALEVETQLIIAKNLGLANKKDCTKIDSVLDEVLRMLNTITAKLRKTST